MTTVYQQIGKFEIVRKLGRGGMADVYLAIDSESKRQVALKLLEIGSDADAQATLAAERHGAILQARLCGIDPHVATVHEYGESDRFFFIAMEHVEGDDLSTVLQRGPLVPDRAIEICIEVCSLLITAHGLELTVEGEPHRGVIHGDLKPKNIRIVADGRVKVLDFGIAKALSMTRKLTRNEFGSVAYASPERLETGEVDVHSDLWSVGVVLYECLAGRQPYQEANTRRLEEIIRSRRTPSSLPQSCPPALQRVLQRALAPELTQRYPTAADFKADLVALREGRPTIADLQPPPHDPDATRRSASASPPPASSTRAAAAAIGAVADVDATRRTGSGAKGAASSPPAAAAGTAPVAASASVPVTTAPGTTPRQRKRIRRPFRIAFLIALLIVTWRELRVMSDANELVATLPLQERSYMDTAWSRYQDLADRSPLGIGVAGAREPLRDRFVDFADRTINGYRSGLTTVYERDWEEARRFLSRALSVGGSDRLIRARLRYSEGHLHRINGDARAKRPQEARAFYNDAIVSFQDAARLNPRWPDPHLGLARVYFYGLEDLEEGIAALERAERVGFKVGDREVAQRADGYRRRADRLWREAASVKGLPQEDEVLERAADADREALRLYASIIGFGDAAAQVGRTRRHIEMIEARLTELRDPPAWPW
jgi:serine/threonine protein kinase